MGEPKQLSLVVICATFAFLVLGLVGGCCLGGGNSDSYGDGVADSLDNCPQAANADQADRNGDGVGDVCDSTPNTPDPGQPDPNTYSGGIIADHLAAAAFDDVLKRWATRQLVPSRESKAMFDSEHKQWRRSRTCPNETPRADGSRLGMPPKALARNWLTESGTNPRRTRTRRA